MLGLINMFADILSKTNLMRAISVTRQIIPCYSVFKVKTYVTNTIHLDIKVNRYIFSERLDSSVDTNNSLCPHSMMETICELTHTCQHNRFCCLWCIQIIRKCLNFSFEVHLLWPKANIHYNTSACYDYFD